MKEKIKLTLISGSVATIVMTSIMIMVSKAGMPEINIGKLMGNQVHLGEFLGWFIHMFIGIAFAWLYINFVKDRINANGILKGMLFSMVPFLIEQLVITPVLGAGLFASNSASQGLVVLSSLVAHIVYGMWLGLLTINDEVSLVDEVNTEVFGI